MKVMISYGVYSKPDMVDWMFSGVTEHFPKDTHVAVFIEKWDGPTEQAVEFGMDRHFMQWPNAVYMGFSVDHLLEIGIHQMLIDNFMKSDCDVLIIPHDDNRFERALIPDLEKLWDLYGVSLGWISGRDGYGFSYEGMVCSPFSQSIGAPKKQLPIGDHAAVRMMNTGPVVYFRHVIEKVGKPDAELPWFFWDDFCLRCHQAGLTNILLSMSCLHEKFGRCGNNPDLYNDQLVADCLKKLNDRWRPVYNRNVI